MSFGARILFEFERMIPGMVNDPAVTASCAAAAFEVFGGEAVLTTGAASLGAEDFADYQQRIPGCMMRLGTGYQDQPVTPLHTPTFDIDERALLYGSRLLLRTLMKLSETPC